MLYLLAIVLAVIIAVVFFGLLIYSIIKKKKQLLIASVVVIIVAAVTGVFCGYMYAVKTVAYVKSSEFQSDINKASSLAGETAGSVASGVSKGLSNTLDDDAIAAMAHKSGKILGKSIKATASGLDSTMGGTSVFMDESVKNDSIEMGRAEEVFDSKSHDIGIFLSFKEDFKGKLKLMLYDQRGQKMDVATTTINEKNGTEKVIRFSFPAQHTGITTYCILSKE